MNSPSQPLERHGLNPGRVALLLALFGLLLLLLIWLSSGVWSASGQQFRLYDGSMVELRASEVGVSSWVYRDRLDRFALQLWPFRIRQIRGSATCSCDQTQAEGQLVWSIRTMNRRNTDSHTESFPILVDPYGYWLIHTETRFDLSAVVIPQSPTSMDSSLKDGSSPRCS